MRDLSRGDRGKEVLDVQTRLRGQGFELGREGVDGFFGPSTEVAVLSFQQERGLLADGRVGANTWRELVEAGYALGDRLLYLREPPFRGDDVLQLQVKLNLLGFNAGAERGVHDEEVERAVLDFQRNAGLPLDGIVGESTLVKLEAVRKAESGREGKKIPERDRGWVAARTLDRPGRSTIDPGHGGADTGCVAADGLAEKDVTLTLGIRLAELLRAEGCRVRLTRETDERVPLYARCEAAEGGAQSFFISLHCNGDASPAARGAATLLLPAQPLLLRARPPARRLRRRAPRGGRRALAGPVRPQLRRPARDQGDRRPGGAALPHLAGRRGARAAAGARGETGARAGRRPHRLSRARAPRGRRAVTPDEADALRIRLTATQSQRLRELGADPLVLDELFDDAASRDAAFKLLENDLVRGGREHLRELRKGRRAPQLVELERDLSDALTDVGFVRVVTPLIIASDALRKMGIEHGHPLREQVFWLDDGRCLRPMLAPNLYTLLRRLDRHWSKPFGIFEIGPCFRRDSKGASHLNEFTMLNLVELGGAETEGRARLEELAALVMGAAGIARLRARGHRVRGVRGDDRRDGGRGRGVLRRPRPSPPGRQLGHRRPVGGPGLRPRAAHHDARGLPQHRARRPQPELRRRDQAQSLAARATAAGSSRSGPPSRVRTRGAGRCGPPLSGRTSLSCSRCYLPSSASIFLTPSLASSA